MKINSKILSIPPYISTSWDQVSSLHTEQEEGYPLLVVTLETGARIEIPRLNLPLIELAFNMHTQYLNEEKATPAANSEQVLNISLPSIRLSSAHLENVATYLQHNDEEKESPDLPAEILNKVASLSKTVGINDPDILPKAEPHCNCPHCQIARAIQAGIQTEEENPETAEEEVRDEDLKFRTWDILQTADKLYRVSNPLDHQEHYSVYLGQPVGCTCGSKNCEHIQAVLKS